MTSIAPVTNRRIEPVETPSTPAADSAPTSDAFASQLDAVGPSERVSSAMPVFHQTSKSGELKPLQKFESFVLQTFVENMLPSENSSFFGEGTAGKIWKSMLAERIGEEMARAGGIGIADMLKKEPSVPDAGSVSDVSEEVALRMPALETAK